MKPSRSTYQNGVLQNNSEPRLFNVAFKPAGRILVYSSDYEPSGFGDTAVLKVGVNGDRITMIRASRMIAMGSGMVFPAQFNFQPILIIILFAGHGQHTENAQQQKSTCQHTGEKNPRKRKRQNLPPLRPVSADFDFLGVFPQLMSEAIHGLGVELGDP